MDRQEKISAIMTQDVIFVQPKDSMEQVCSIFKAHNIHHIPVTEDQKVVGIISKGDVQKLEHHFTLFNNERSKEINAALMRSLLVEEVMTKQVAKISPDDTLELAAGLFKENLFHALPVVDIEDRLVGIVTTYDMLTYAFKDEILLLD